MTSVFLGIKRRKFNKKDVHKYTSLLRFYRFNISLASCSAAELVSVSVEHCKNQSSKLYLQTVKKVNHVQCEAYERYILKKNSKNTRSSGNVKPPQLGNYTSP